MNLASEEDERTLRLRYTDERLRGQDARATGSWNDLTRAEAGRLIAALKRDLGADAVQPKVSPAGRGVIAALALELWGGQWDEFLSHRIEARFQKHRIEDLVPHQVQALIDELLSRIAHRDLRQHGVPYYGGVEIPGEVLKEKIAEIRERFMPAGGWPSGWNKS